MKIVKLHNLCDPDQIGKYGIPASAEEYSSAKTRYLRISDIDDNGKLLNNDKKSVSSINLEKYILKEGDIVFARTGNSTGRTYFHEEKNGKLAFAGFLIKYGLDETKVNPKYLKYFTISKEYKKWVQNLSLGSTRGNINAQTFADCPIILPTRFQQDYLVKILSIIDSKIEFNNKINAELEAMAKMVYDYWFVQFDFPDENGKPYKSSGGKMEWSEELKRKVPDKWELKTLAEITDVSNESLNPMNTPDKEFKHYSLPAFDEIGTYKIEKGEEIKSNKFVVKDTDLLVSKLNPWFNRVIFSTDESDLIGSTEFVIWRTKNLAIKNYMYMIARDNSFILYCTKSASGTSNSHKRVNPTVMMKYQIAYNEKIANLFGVHIESINKMYAKNDTENQALTTLRDWLLPLLMNGQVKVN